VGGVNIEPMANMRVDGVVMGRRKKIERMKRFGLRYIDIYISSCGRGAGCDVELKLKKVEPDSDVPMRTYYRWDPHILAKTVRKKGFQFGLCLF
jgi:hypothetical protein